MFQIKQARRAVLISLAVLPVWIFALLGFLVKSACFGPKFDKDGATVGLTTTRLTGRLCATDVQVMWDQRHLVEHLFPYLFGSFTPPATLTGGTVEYPVFSGLFMWVSALAASNGLEFLAITTVLMAIASTVIALVLVNLVGRWALLWSFAPALFLYTSYNWDMLPVMCTVLAIWTVVRGPDRWSRNTRNMVAAVLLGVGCLFKLYPALFLIPLALSALTWAAGRYDWRALIRVLVVGMGTVVLGNLPFALLGFEGWWASFQFQSQRVISADTLSIWFWGATGVTHWAPVTGAWLSIVTLISSACVAIACAVAVWIGWRKRAQLGFYPWVQVAAVLLTAYLVLNKVHSLQYTLWLIPFMVILTVPLWQIFAYYIVDAGLFISWFLSMYFDSIGSSNALLSSALVYLIWARLALLVVLSIAFMRSETRWSTRLRTNSQ
jgi:uncharacterized membrane protein